MPPEPLLPVGAELKRLRLERRLSLRKAAELALVDYSRLREYERGIDNHTGQVVTPPFEVVRKLARAYGVQPEPLLELAGYTPIGRLGEYEATLVTMARQLNETQKLALLDYLENVLSQQGT